MRITFAKQKRPTGLAGVVYQGENYDIKVDGEKKGVVSKDTRSESLSLFANKYYWYSAYIGMSKNTLNEGIVFDTVDDAKADVKKFLKTYFAEKAKNQQ